MGGGTGWTYQRTFEATPQQLAMKTVELVCHGLDTFATVTLNGTVLGSTNNMFRTWVFDVRQALKPGTNDLQIEFRPLPEPAEIKGWIKDYVKLHPEWVTGGANPNPGASGGAGSARRRINGAGIGASRS